MEHTTPRCQRCSRPVGRKKRRKVAGGVYCRPCAAMVESTIEEDANREMYGDDAILLEGSDIGNK